MFACLAVGVSADYIHGYFRYTVNDGSVIIKSYQGTETEVTVPSMIGKNPVNVIASGAFAKNKNVKTVYLPDTIMTVEPGAFGADQKVIYAAESPEVIRGDVNGDRALSNIDVVLLFRYLSAADKLKDERVCDFNADGTVNNKDVVALFKYVSR